MDRHKRPLLLLQEVLCRFSGEDPKLISDAGLEPGLVSRFAVIGVLVLAIFILSFYSSSHFVSNLLNGSHFVAMPIGIVWGLMIVVIYQLLLFTITPAMLIGRERSIKGQVMPVTTEKKGLARVSLVFRIAFVVLIAVVVAQPWLVTLFDTSIELDRYRHKYRSEFIVQADSSLIGMEMQLGAQLNMDEAVHDILDKGQTRMIRNKIDIDRSFISASFSLEQELTRKLGKLKGYRPDTLEDRLSRLVAEEETSDSVFLLGFRLYLSPGSNAGAGVNADVALADVVRKKIQCCRRLDALLSSNNFYTKKVQLVNSGHPMAWVITVLVIGVFVTPIALKYHIRNGTGFYKQKKELEERMVRKAYLHFKGNYSKIFRDKFSIDMQFYESCIDPPFNTKKKDTIYLDEKDLLAVLYPDEEASEKNKYLVGENIN